MKFSITYFFNYFTKLESVSLNLSLELCNCQHMLEPRSPLQLIKHICVSSKIQAKFPSPLKQPLQVALTKDRGTGDRCVSQSWRSGSLLATELPGLNVLPPSIPQGNSNNSKLTSSFGFIFSYGYKMQWFFLHNY